MKQELPTPTFATGKVRKAFGNLLQVEFFGDIRQGEVAMVHLQESRLKGEVIEIIGQEAKIQVFENTAGIGEGSDVSFTGDLLEAELGPGLLSSIVDGLQNPLQKIAEEAGYFLPRGTYLAPLNRTNRWDFEPTALKGERLVRGDFFGFVREGRFRHPITVPFNLWEPCTLDWVAPSGSYTVEEEVARATTISGKKLSLTMLQKWPIKTPLLAGKRVQPTSMMETGLRIIDTQFPIAKGGTFCTPGPFGAGKTVLQHHLSKYSSVDIVVVVACGERAGEVVEILREFPHLQDPYSGEALMTRTVIVCNTSSMPVAARESSIYMGMTIAEYYRQLGLDVLLLADSTSRWAQALREMSGRLEEIPGEEAFPAYLASRIAEFYERAGVVELSNESRGSVTLCGAVSPAGGNFEEPVTQATLSVVGAFLGLSRERSDARRYPSIDPLTSYTKYLPLIGEILEERQVGWRDKVDQAARITREGDEIAKRMEVVGEEGTALKDFILYLKKELIDFSYLQQNAFDVQDRYCPLERQFVLFSLIDRLLRTEFLLTSHREAREFFLRLQNSIKDLNYLSFDTPTWKEAVLRVEKMIESREGEKTVR